MYTSADSQEQYLCPAHASFLSGKTRSTDSPDSPCDQHRAGWVEGGQHGASSAEQIQKKSVCVNVCVLQICEITYKRNLSEVRKRIKRKRIPKLY